MPEGCSGPQTGPVPAKHRQVTPMDGTQIALLTSAPIATRNAVRYNKTVVFKPLSLGMICYLRDHSSR